MLQVAELQQASQNFMVPIDLDAKVWGDAAFSVHHCSGDGATDDAWPLFVHSFHTAFTPTGMVRLSLQQVWCMVYCDDVSRRGRVTSA